VPEGWHLGNPVSINVYGIFTTQEAADKSRKQIPSAKSRQMPKRIGIEMLTKNRQGLRCTAGLSQEQSCGTDKASYRKMGAFFCYNKLAREAWQRLLPKPNRMP